MKFARMVTGVAIAALTLPYAGQAAEGYKTAVVNAIQNDRTAAAEDPVIVNVAQGGTWTVAPGVTLNCLQEWSIFDAKLNPHFLATVLAAGIADKVVTVYVDDSLPKINGKCQVKYLTLMPAP